jgi:hypothetical protein
MTHRLLYRRGFFAALVSFALPLFAWADISNTAQASYVDEGGHAHQALSNTVLVTVSSVLSPPVIQGFDHLPAVLAPNDTIRILIENSYDQITWVFSPRQPGTSVPSSFASAAAPPTYSLSTPAPAIQLESVPQMASGFWHVEVTAHNQAGVSNTKSADFQVDSSDLSSARVHPNPFRAARGDQNVIFDRLPDHSTVKIFSVSGRSVKTLDAASGSATWDLTNEAGDRVASGIYLYVIDDNQDHHEKGKLVLIR